MLNGIRLADYVDKIIGKSYFAQKSLRLTEINAQTSHFWSVVVLLLLKNSFEQDLFTHGIHGHKCPMANAVERNLYLKKTLPMFFSWEFSKIINTVVFHYNKWYLFFERLVIM